VESGQITLNTLAIVIGAFVGVLAPTFASPATGEVSRVNSNDVCDKRWEYASDTWRITPDELAVEGTEVTLKWHILDVYIPGSPDANAGLQGKISLQLDDGPVITQDIDQPAHKLVKRRWTITDLKPGKHHIKLALWAGSPVGYFTSCVHLPAKFVVRTWKLVD